MKSTLEPLEGDEGRTLVKLSVEVDEAEFDRDIDAAFRKIAREVRIPGFRPGKAPRRVLEARMGVAPAREQALRDAIPSYLAKAVREHDVDIIATPEVDITGGEEDGPVQFDATVEVRPRVSVPGYGGLRVEVPNPAVPDEDVDARVDTARRPFGELTDVERPAAKGDMVTLDLAATRDGEPVPGLTAEDWMYELGQGWIAEDFDDYIAGALADDKREFTATPSGTEEPAEFQVTVKKVQELVLPDFSDEWVSENTDFESAEAFRDAQRTQMEGVRLAQVRQLVLERATDALAELVAEDPPEVLVNNELRQRVENTVMRLQAQGIGDRAVPRDHRVRPGRVRRTAPGRLPEGGEGRSRRSVPWPRPSSSRPTTTTSRPSTPASPCRCGRSPTPCARPTSATMPSPSCVGSCASARRSTG